MKHTLFSNGQFLGFASTFDHLEYSDSVDVKIWYNNLKCFLNWALIYKVTFSLNGVSSWIFSLRKLIFFFILKRAFFNFGQNQICSAQSVVSENVQLSTLKRANLINSSWFSYKLNFIIYDNLYIMSSTFIMNHRDSCDSARCPVAMLDAPRTKMCPVEICIASWHQIKYILD